MLTQFENLHSQLNIWLFICKINLKIYTHLKRYILIWSDTCSFEQIRTHLKRYILIWKYTYPFDEIHAHLVKYTHLIRCMLTWSDAYSIGQIHAHLQLRARPNLHYKLLHFRLYCLNYCCWLSCKFVMVDGVAHLC